MCDITTEKEREGGREERNLKNYIKHQILEEKGSSNFKKYT